MVPPAGIDQDHLSPGFPTLTLTLTARQRCDVELLLNGGFAPLTTFLNQADYLSVLQHQRLTSGALWPMPITLDIAHKVAEKLSSNDVIALRDAEGLLIAVLHVREWWPVDKHQEALAVYGTDDMTHPGVAYLFHHTKECYVSGELIKIALPHHYDFTHLRHTPAELRQLFAAWGWDKVVGFQTRNPLHRAHQVLTQRAAEMTGAKLLLHPVVGMTKPGDIDYFLRVRCYEHVLKTYAPGQACLSLLPLAMRMAGPREALWHALIRKNYGCTHFIVGRDHAGPGKDSEGQPFYAPYAAQEAALAHQAELGIEILPFAEMVYSPKHQSYFAANDFPADDTPVTLSGTELRERLQQQRDIPEWFSYPAVINELRQAYPPKHEMGLTLFLTGLPSSGKSTLANALLIKLRELTGRKISLLDGDEIRTHLSYGLGFSPEDRAANVLRVGFVAKEITKHGGIVICALVSPHAQPRAEVREMISAVGGFVEVYVCTPLTVCEKRDRKGLYKKARSGEIPQFTGVSDQYEPPSQPEIMIDTSTMALAQIIDKVTQELQLLGYIL